MENRGAPAGRGSSWGRSAMRWRARSRSVRGSSAGSKARRQYIGAAQVERRQPRHDIAADVEHRHGVEPNAAIGETGALGHETRRIDRAQMMQTGALGPARRARGELDLQDLVGFDFGERRCRVVVGKECRPRLRSGCVASASAVAAQARRASLRCRCRGTGVGRKSRPPRNPSGCVSSSRSRNAGLIGTSTMPARLSPC